MRNRSASSGYAPVTHYALRITTASFRLRREVEQDQLGVAVGPEDEARVGILGQGHAGLVARRQRRVAVEGDGAVDDEQVDLPPGGRAMLNRLAGLQARDVDRRVLVDLQRVRRRALVGRDDRQQAAGALVLRELALPPAGL